MGKWTLSKPPPPFFRPFTSFPSPWLFLPLNLSLYCSLAISTTYRLLHLPSKRNILSTKISCFRAPCNVIISHHVSLCLCSMCMCATTHLHSTRIITEHISQTGQQHKCITLKMLHPIGKTLLAQKKLYIPK